MHCRLANLLPWAFPKHVIMLQDFMLPRSRMTSFLEYLQEKLQLWPIWLLPMRNIKVHIYTFEQLLLLVVVRVTHNQTYFIHYFTF